MIKTFYNRYSDDQKVSFWMVVSNIVLVVFTFGFGLLIQDNMVSKTQSLNQRLKQYEYGIKVLPAVKQVYTNGGASKLLYSMSKLTSFSDSDIDGLSEYIENEYFSNRAAFLNASDSLIKIMGELKYYLPEWKDSIDVCNTQLIIATSALKELASTKNIQNSVGINSLKEQILSSPELWIYGNGLDGVDIVKLDCQLSDLGEKLREVRESSKSLNEIGDTLASDIPEISLSIKNFNDEYIKRFERLFILPLSKAYIKDLKLLHEIAKGNDIEDNAGKIYNLNWVSFFIALVIAVCVATFFAVLVFPRKFNRNHTSEEYETINKKLQETEALLYQYERQLKDIDLVKDEKNSYTYTYRSNS